MYYDCKDILPSEVKASLDEKGQELWMKAFNKTVRKSKDTKVYRAAVFDAWQAMKSYPGCRYFSGFVSTDILDKQNDIVVCEKAYERISNHIERGGTMIDTHTNRTVGTFIYADIRKSASGHNGIYAYGVIYQGEPYHDTVWNQIKKGIECPSCMDVRKGFSIGGFALDTRSSCDASGCHRDILDMSIHEISVCKDPASPESMIQDVNMLAKSMDTIEQSGNAINKTLRDDEPAMEAQPSAMPQAPQMPGQMAGQEQQPATNADRAKQLVNDAKDVEKFIKEMQKLQEQWAKIMPQASGQPAQMPGEAQPPEGMAKAEAGGITREPDVKRDECGCQNLNTELHTPHNQNCPRPKAAYGDTHDAWREDKFVEPHQVFQPVQPDNSMTNKAETDLMPGKADMKPLGFKDGPKGPSSETRVLPGYANLKETNKAMEMTTAEVPAVKVPIDHLKEDMEEEEEILDAAHQMKHEDEEVLSGMEKNYMDDLVVLTPELRKQLLEGGWELRKDDNWKNVKKPGNHMKTVTDKGEYKDSNKIKGKVDLPEMKDTAKACMGGDGIAGGKVEIPAELKPAFDQFLQEKGISVKPEVDNPEIEAPLEKKVLISEKITPETMKSLANKQYFESSVAKTLLALEAVKSQNALAKSTLFEGVKIMDPRFLTTGDTFAMKDLAKSSKDLLKKSEKTKLDDVNFTFISG